MPPLTQRIPNLRKIGPFPNNVTVPSIIVTEAALQGQNIQCLIGRDILQNGVFIYNGHDNSFTITF